MSYRLITAAAVALGLAGCAQRPPPAPVATDPLNDGIAKSCTYSPVEPKAGTTVQATISMSNDGWCAYRASESQGQAFQLGLVKSRPAHGELQIRQWAGETRVEYNPHAGFTGTDRFEVALRPTGGGADRLVAVSATVTRGEGVAAVSAPAAETPAKPTSTTRRSSTRRSTTRH